jgi:hypothetical protein
VLLVVGLGLGFPALRVQTIYLAFATLGFNTAVWLVMRNEEWLTGGTFGINNIARPELLGLSLEGNLPYYYFVLGVAVVMARCCGACCAALGQGLHRAARQPDPRRKPGHRHPQLHAAELCHRRGVCRRGRRAVRQRWCSSSSPRRSPWARPS